MYKVKSYNMLNNYIALTVISVYAIGTIELIGWSNVVKILVDSIL